MDKDMLYQLIDAVKNENLLESESPDIRIEACRLVCYILINNNLILKLDTLPAKTLEGLLVHTVADWVARINEVTNQPGCAEDKPSLALSVRS